MKPTNLVSLDFDQIRESIKSYLRTRREFTDYDFTGSTLSYLIDVLAYNTYYSAFNANMALNEIFLDTASIRDNVVSLARYLNYTPKSATAAKACITLTAQTALSIDGTFPTTATVKKGDITTGTLNGRSYTFVTLDDITSPVNKSTGLVSFGPFIIYEGNLLSYQYIVDSTINQSFIVPNDSVDTDTIRVYVRPNVQSTQYDRYNLVKNITTVESNDKIYFLNETNDRRYEVSFGDGIIGRKLVDNEVIYIEYLKTNTRLANNIHSMSYIGIIQDSNGSESLTVDLTVNDKSQLGDEPESIRSIKFNAPKYYATQNRAVTSKDYEAIIRNIYPNAKYVNVFGGELLSPPVYGKVIVAIKTSTGTKLNNLTKKELISKLKPYAMASIETIIVDPDEYYLSLGVFIAANTFKSVLSESTLSSNTSVDIQNKVQSAIQQFGNEQDLGNFGKTLSLSQLEKIILNADENINDVQFAITPYKTIEYDILGSPKKWNLDFGVALNCSCDSAAGFTVRSSRFYTPGISEAQYLRDDGNGNLISYYTENNKFVITNKNAGTYDCTTGKVIVGPLFEKPLKSINDSSPVQGDAGGNVQVDSDTSDSSSTSTIPSIIVVSINPLNPNSITVPSGAILSLSVPNITIGPNIPDSAVGGSTGIPDGLVASPDLFTFTSPVAVDSAALSCFV
jgi:hypothetical protein